MNALDALKEDLLSSYEASHWPCLLDQYADWSQQRPLQGLRILDATPLFRNTLAKFMALLAAGAELFVHDRAKTMGDPEALARACSLGVRCLSMEEFKAMELVGEPMDMILDCMGLCCDLNPRYGYVELTRSGVPPYLEAKLPVIVADAGRVKLLETSLGTSDGFFRALEYLGHADWAGRSLVVVGCGKVGLGVIYRAQAMGMQVTAMDIKPCDALPEGVDFLLMSQRVDVQACMESAWCVVTVTGLRDVLSAYVDVARLAASPALLANLGVHDEYGPLVPKERVLAQKESLNFILKDPTAMMYIETTMALHNACALDLLRGDLPAGCQDPSPVLEAQLLANLRAKGPLPESQFEWLELCYNSLKSASS